MESGGSICWHCHKPGHTRFSCPFLGREQISQPTKGVVIKEQASSGTFPAQGRTKREQSSSGKGKSQMKELPCEYCGSWRHEIDTCPDLRESFKRREEQEKISKAPKDNKVPKELRRCQGAKQAEDDLLVLQRSW